LLAEVFDSFRRFISRIPCSLCVILGLRFRDTARTVNSHIFHDQYSDNQQYDDQTDDKYSAHDDFLLKFIFNRNTKIIIAQIQKKGHGLGFAARGGSGVRITKAGTRLLASGFRPRNIL
jgi:hypothetical protein